MRTPLLVKNNLPENIPLNTILFLNNEYYDTKSTPNLKYINNEWIFIKKEDIVLCFLTGKELIRNIETITILSSNEPTKYVSKKLVFDSKSKNIFDGYFKGMSDSNDIIFATDSESLISLGFIRSEQDGIYYRNYENIKRKKQTGVYIKGEFSSKTKLNKKNTHLISPFDFTFGIELETCSGLVTPPEWLNSNVSGVTCMRDGSISGGEYVSPVLNGDRGFEYIQDLCLVLSKYTDIDQNCGVHVHVGNCEFNQAFTINSFILGCLLEDEIFSYLSPYRLNNSTCGMLAQIKDNDNKNVFYTLMNIMNQFSDYKLKIKSGYEYLFNCMSNGRNLSPDVNKKLPHPGGRFTDRYSRKISLDKLFRYKWLNLIPCNFNQRNYPIKKDDDFKKAFTIEFRCLHATLNADEIITWIHFYFAFINYLKNTSDIVNIDNYLSLNMKIILLNSYDLKKTNTILKTLQKFRDTRGTSYFSFQNAKTIETKSIKSLCV
jgi:hypothetical protein